MLVTVKSADTAAMADIIARHAPSDAVIVSLQNGVGNAAVLRDRLPGRRVLGGMVPFNVMALGDGRFHRATSGDIVIEQDEARTGRKAVGAGPEDAADRQHRRRAMGQAAAQSQQRAQCAGRPAAAPATRLSGHGGDCSPTRWRKAWLRSAPRASSRFRRRRSRRRGCRRCCACRISIFEPMLGRTMKIDPEARSSMWEDLQQRPAHRDRLSAGRHHRDRRAARAGGAAVAPDRGTDPAGRARRPRARPA